MPAKNIFLWATLSRAVYRRARAVFGGAKSAGLVRVRDGRVDLPDASEIVRGGPGSCPICGMALEPVVPTAEDADNPELRDMRRRFWVAAAACRLRCWRLPWRSRCSTASLPPRLGVWVQLVLATPAVAWAGAPFFRRGWESVVNRRSTCSL